MDLYGLAPEEFTAARDAAAKDDKTLKALRKPTVSAWVINTLVRDDPKVLDELSDLGTALLEAQSSGDGQQLRALTEQRRQLVASVTRHALGLVRRQVSSAAALEVEATLEAALADPASAEAVRSGQLVRPLAYSGFGAVDLDGAVAPLPRVTSTSRTASPTKTSPTNTSPTKTSATKTSPTKTSATKTSATKTPRTEAPDTAAAEAEAHDAAGRLDDAVARAAKTARAASDAEGEVTHAREQEDEAAEAVAQAREQLAAAEAALTRTKTDRRGAQQEHEAVQRKAAAASKAVAAAQDAADAARRALDALRRG